MATTNSVNVGLSGSTGSGNFAGSTSATFVTPTLGAATATTIAFSPTTGGIIGTTAADNAGAGKVGEEISSVIGVASSISITSGVAKNLTSISLTAGDWDVFGNVYFIANTGTMVTLVRTGISSTSATLPDSSLYASMQATLTTASFNGLSAPYQRININSTTTYYIVASTTFSVSTMLIAGGIYARRAR